MNEDYVYINKHIDSLPMFLNWEIDVILVFVGCFYSGIIFSNTFSTMFFFVILGIIFSWIYNKIKNSSIRGFYKHWIYATNIKSTKYLVPSNKRFFVGN